MVKVSVNLPQELVDDLDDLAKDVETDRTDIIEEFLVYGLENVDDVFPEEEEGESEAEASEEAESEE